MARAHILTAMLILLVVSALSTAATAAATHEHARRCKHRICRTHPKKSHAARHSATTVGTISPPVTIAGVLAESCQNTSLTPTPQNLQAIREATLCLINQERARNGELPLTVDQRLQQAAQSHSERMISEDYFAHISPGGETPGQRVTGTGYIPNDRAGYAIGENIAWGTLSLATPQAIVAAWIASPGHLANILESSYQDTGIGVGPGVPSSLSEGQPGGIYSEVFGVVR